MAVKMDFWPRMNDELLLPSASSPLHFCMYPYVQQEAGLELPSLGRASLQPLDFVISPDCAGWRFVRVYGRTGR